MQQGVQVLLTPEVEAVVMPEAVEDQVVQVALVSLLSSTQ
jgi:hypothetical protein